MSDDAFDAIAWLPTDETPLLDAAIAYASHGFRVVSIWWVKSGPDRRCACGAPECKGVDSAAGKHPIGAQWQKRATSDVDAIREARKKKPYANVGLAMGGPQRLVAVDIDGAKGRASLAELEAGVQPLPATLASRTGRPDGGEHRIFRVPAHLDIKRLGNRASFRMLGIDTRIDNGQIVVAPSLHVSGGRYTWSVRSPIAEMPEWLFEALAAPIALGGSGSGGRSNVVAPAPVVLPTPARGDYRAPYLRKTIDNAAAAIAGAPKGGRNQLLYAKSCTVFEYHVGEGIDHLPAWNALAGAGKACGLSEAEVSATLAKAWRKAQAGATPRRVPPPDGAPPSSASSGSATPASAPSATGAAWTEVGGATASAAAGTTGAASTASTWESTLIRSAEGYVKNTFGNICKVLRHADEFRGRLAFNQMRVTPHVDGRPLRDTDLARLREKIEERWGFSPPRDGVVQAVGLIAEEHAFHPVQDYLKALTWDGTRRIEHVASTILGLHAPDALTQRMLFCWFVSAVARALQPGCKVDTTFVLVGEPSRKKSTFFSVLGGEWFSNSYADIRTKDGVLQVHAAWIYEWPEIDRVTTKNDSSDVKAFLTIARDDLRPPYGMGIVTQPRSSVIVGTTNRPFLDDETGSRRFHAVRVEQLVDVATLATWRDQLWAEAVAALRAGATWWLSEEEDRARELHASEHTVDNPWLERIGNFLRNPVCSAAGVSIADVMVGALGVDVGRAPPSDTARVGKSLRQLGWVPRQETRGTARIRVYRPAGAYAAAHAAPPPRVAPASHAALHAAAAPRAAQAAGLPVQSLCTDSPTVSTTSQTTQGEQVNTGRVLDQKEWSGDLEDGPGKSPGACSPRAPVQQGAADGIAVDTAPATLAPDGSEFLDSWLERQP